MISRRRLENAHERRACRRVAEDLGIAVSVLAGPETAPALAGPAFHLTSDISEGGLRFSADQALEPGTRLRVYVALRQPLTTLTQFAQVRWARAAAADTAAREVGIEFTDGPDRDRQIWSEYVRQAATPGASTP